MKKKIIPVIAIIAVVLASIAWLRQNGQQVQTELTLHGNVDIRQVELAFNANGRIAQIMVQEGDQVKAEQLLARLDTERLRLSLAQADAQASAQRAVVGRYRAGSRPEEISQARAQRDAAQAAAEDAEAYYKRQIELVARNFVSQQQADSARFARDKAQQQLKAAQEALHLTELGPRKEDIAAAQARLDADEATLAVIRRDIQEGSLYAPADGVIENRILEPGDLASPQKPVLTLALTDPLWVRAYLPENALGRVPIGTPAWVQTDSQPDKRYRAWIGYVSPSAEFTPKAVETTEIRTSLVYQVRVFVCDGRDALRQGMPATVVIPLDQAVPAQRGNPCRTDQ